jgi:stage II sporulation protein AA (anti-sigma F factor antagonist)
LQVRFERKKGTLIAYLDGDIDHHSSRDIKEKIDYELLKPITRNLVMDFENVSFMDSSGIGIIFGRYNNVKNFGGKMGIASLSDNLLRIIKLSGADRYVGIYDKTHNAVDAFNY